MIYERKAAPVVGFIADLFFASRLEASARRAGYDFIQVERADQIAPAGADDRPQQLAEHLVGQSAVLIDRLSIWRPALAVFDLDNAAVPWQAWVALIKSAPATRRIPVLCYGPHVNPDVLKRAKHAGADLTLARSQFASRLPQLITQYARVEDLQALESTCHERLSSLAVHGLDLFNHGEFFEAHEALEAAWNQDDTPGRELYRAVLQIAVAYLQIERGNYNGALKMFLRVRQWIDPLPDFCRGVNVAQLRLDARQVYQVLIEGGRNSILEIDHSLFKPVIYTLEP